MTKIENDTMDKLVDKMFQYSFNALSNNPEKTIYCSMSNGENTFNVSVGFTDQTKQINNNIISISQIPSDSSHVYCDIIFESKRSHDVSCRCSWDLDKMFIRNSSMLPLNLFIIYQTIKNIRKKLNLHDEQDYINWVIMYDFVSKYVDISMKEISFKIIMEDKTEYESCSFLNFLNTLQIRNRGTNIQKFKIIINEDI